MRIFGEIPNRTEILQLQAELLHEIKRVEEYIQVRGSRLPWFPFPSLVIPEELKRARRAWARSDDADEMSRCLEALKKVGVNHV